MEEGEDIQIYWTMENWAQKIPNKESTGKKVEVVWACDAKRGTLRRKEGNGNESTGDKEERKT